MGYPITRRPLPTQNYTDSLLQSTWETEKGMSGISSPLGLDKWLYKLKQNNCLKEVVTQGEHRGSGLALPGERPGKKHSREPDI